MLRAIQLWKCNHAEGNTAVEVQPCWLVEAILFMVKDDTVAGGIVG